MAAAKNENTKTDAPVVKVDDADHDRVAMLSLKADGTPDQTNPEIIGPKDDAVEAAKEQFAQKAVSAADDGEKSAADLEKVAAAAEKQAESVVNSLHQG